MFLSSACFSSVKFGLLRLITLEMPRSDMICPQLLIMKEDIMYFTLSRLYSLHEPFVFRPLSSCLNCWK